MRSHRFNQCTRMAAALLATLFMSACATDLHKNAALALGPQADFTEAELTASTTQQDAVVAQCDLASFAPLKPRRFQNDVLLEES